MRRKQRHFSIADVTKCLKNRKIQPIDIINKSAYKKHCIYSLLCLDLHVIDNFKNRLLIKVTIQRHEDEIVSALRTNITATHSARRAKQTDHGFITIETDESKQTAISHDNMRQNELCDLRSNSDISTKTTDDIASMNTTEGKTCPRYRFMKKLSFSKHGCEGIESINRKLREKLPEIGITCVVTFKGSHKRKSNKHLLVEYGLCKHTSCRKFRIDIVALDTEYNVTVAYDKELDEHKEEQHSYQLRGSEREDYKLSLVHTFPNSRRREDISKSKEELLEEGNWQTVRSLGVYQKVRSDAKAADDKHHDPHLDLVLRSIHEPNDETKYIQNPSGGILVYLYSKQQLNILLPRGKKHTVYFDATGSVVRQPKTTTKRIYYAVVVNFHSKIVPIASSHDAATIANFWISYKRFASVTCLRPWPVFEAIVVDFSFAIVTAVCLGINEMTL